MFSNQFAEISLNAPCKSLTSVKADKVESRFILGTCPVVTRTADADVEPSLHVVRYHSEVNEIGIDATLSHPTGPIQHIVTSPQDRTLIVTVAEESNNATLYKLPANIMELTNDFQDNDDEDDDDPSLSSSYRNDQSSSMSASGRSASSQLQDRLEQKCTLEHENQQRLTDIVWRGVTEDDVAATSSHSTGDVITLDETGTITQWDLSLGMAESIRSLQSLGDKNDNNSLIKPCSLLAPPRVAWDPHDSNAMAVSYGRSVYMVDGRVDTTSVPAGTVDCIRNGHRYGIAHLDYNPNKPHVLATAGLDGLLHFWDLRNAKCPLLTARGGHSHYVWNVQYNPFHDQLIVSTGTDTVVNLWRCSTISSAPLLTLEEEAAANDANASETAAPNVRVSRFEHGDACYASTWGAADAWLYLSAGYDGRVVLHHVPSKEKYKILL